MHPMLFESWWRNESARVQERAEMAAAVMGAKPGKDGGRWSRAGRRLGTVRSGRRTGRIQADALTFGPRVAGHLSPPVTTTATYGKRG